MKRLRLTAFIHAALIACALLVVGAGLARADTLADIKARGTLRVGIDLTLPPYGMMDANMQPTGSDVAAAHLLADYLGVKLQIVPSVGANRIPVLQTGKVDVVMSSFSITAARKKVVDFSIPYGIISIVCAAPPSIHITGPKDLEGKTVAVTRGTGADMNATLLAKADPKINVIRFEDDATLITALASGQANIMISAPAQMNDANKRNPALNLQVKFVLRTNGYAVGIRKGDDALRKAVNDWIRKDLADGTLREVYKKFQGADLPAHMPTE